MSREITIRVEPRRVNPSAEAIREEFTGKPAIRSKVYDEPLTPPGDYADLGKLLALHFKPLAGGQVQQIYALGNTRMVSDERGNIWFVGGEQDVSESLTQVGARQRADGLWELGEARRIDYKQRKQHVEHPEHDEWQHLFGEENGVRPKVLFDAQHKRLLLEGGAYEIRREGIVN